MRERGHCRWIFERVITQMMTRECQNFRDCIFLDNSFFAAAALILVKHVSVGFVILDAFPYNFLPFSPILLQPIRFDKPKLRMIVVEERPGMSGAIVDILQVGSRQPLPDVFVDMPITKANASIRPTSTALINVNQSNA